MAKDILYTNGAIAVKEKNLLKDKLLRFTEMTAEDAFRALSESGFGGGAEVCSVYEYERLIAAEEQALDGFVREYAPSFAEKAYLLAPRDFHNAKALVKAEYSGGNADKMLAPEGLIPVAEIADCVKERNFSPLGKELGGAAEQALAPLGCGGEISGAEIGILFEKAQHEYLRSACARCGILKKLLVEKADKSNILTAMRSKERAFAEKSFLNGGKLDKERLLSLVGDAPEAALGGTPYAAFYRKCFEAKKAGLPMTEAERDFECTERDYFAARRYELERNQPFLYYVFRKRAEASDVRIVFVCLLAGMNERDIKKRLRTY